MLDPAVFDPVPSSAPAIPRPPRRLIPWLGILQFTVQGVFSALTAVLLPNQLTALDEPHKVANLALVTSISFALAIVVQPVVGTLSDRTRGRLGRRAPWMLGGAVAAAAVLALVGHLDSIGAVAACWVGVQIAFNAILAPFSAVLPDRIPSERRGVASAAIGFGFMVGAAVAVVIAGQLARDLPLAYTAFGLAVLVGVVLFVVVNRDRTIVARQLPPLCLRSILAAFWVNPRRHPDFAWAFAGRFLFVIGYYSVFTFNLYVLTDYVGMTLDEANAGLGLLSAATVLGAIAAILVGGFLSDRLRCRKPFIYAASVFMAVGLAVPLISPTFAAIVVLSALFGIGFGLYQVCDTVLMTEVLPDADGAAAKDLGVLNLANAIPQAVAPALGAALVLATGGYIGLFAVGIGIVLIAAAAIWPIRSVR
ncbi:MFS transporter [Microbacterium sp. 18062]|uniref:MFS transporter n=1 Tax=Microbacterium sp. 18062 TaxID=2681410 RepID=UPI00135AD80E|nr:MFS transporter [Microbacterium sp. 18062]